MSSRRRMVSLLKLCQEVGKTLGRPYLVQNFSKLMTFWPRLSCLKVRYCSLVAKTPSISYVYQSLISVLVVNSDLSYSTLLTTTELDCNSLISVISGEYLVLLIFRPLYSFSRNSVACPDGSMISG